ncbi:MAG: hypothetical protein ACXABY_11430 [Candidatus Thorarchaeota archaeon]|jgi:hypothetical protein
MGKWQHRISLKDIHDHYHKHKDIKHCGKMLAERLRELRLKFMDSYSRRRLEQLSENFEKVQDVEEFDDYLNELYNWADNGRRCFIDAFK